jgi:hypothetical protein
MEKAQLSHALHQILLGEFPRFTTLKPGYPGHPQMLSVHGGIRNQSPPSVPFEFAQSGTLEMMKG